MELKNNLTTETGWEIIQDAFDPEDLVTTGSNFMIGNGYLGYRGTFDNWGPEEFVACVVTDTWDQAKDSRWSELCNVPNGLFSEIKADGETCSLFSGSLKNYSHRLDLRYGLNSRKIQWVGSNGQGVELESRKFASYDTHNLLVQEFKFSAVKSGIYTLKTGINGEVWSLNGSHFKSGKTLRLTEDLIGSHLQTYELGTEVAIVEGVNLKGNPPEEMHISKSGDSIFREYTFHLKPGETVALEKVIAIAHSNELEDPLGAAQKMVHDALGKGYAELFTSHKKPWDAFWKISDIQISGNPEAQLLTRFNLYQAFIATPTHANLPVGARGLSCQVYQGAAFWDQETYNLPMFAFTHPEIAERLVAYRYDTLQGARRKAQGLGYYGAFYAWTSGKTGDELFPDFFFTDVLTGRPIRNHFNCWQIHISPDVVYGIWLYYQATGDWDFIVKQGAEVLFEVAHFLVSRVHLKKDKGRYEIIRVLGPDEYHENVDNNAFTNYLARYALQKACIVYDRLAIEQNETLKALVGKIELPQMARGDWQEISENLFLPQPDPETGIIEQFDGYFKLEDIRPDALRKRLIDPGEYWGWPNGIAIHTQVLKQADVIQLLAMLDGFSQEILTANYEYYEPRTEHGSSLSPSVHALVASKAGHPEEAYRYFLESAGIDLYNESKKVMSGGSFLGGIHTAAAGGVWLILVKGFAGMVLTDDGVSFRPALPETWDAYTFKIRIKGCLLEVGLNQKEISILNVASNSGSLRVAAKGKEAQLHPGETFLA
ncbi:glycosyl hydrolase family 65 protein [Robiginitalea aurantiaca]|uniref:Glycosyl hydrolase family 65 protein n=1 Tax=Robiginitalea aurantiaca TaxID=3056915 RepID=A0ABT7WDL7_9FLAO|nr:glycosyl hydrolase family 65 protein [Robiginitalea aurantiaca]MDM9631010.1 glycosyl hydrolase family 65 protein [Robiginitalea aurantiaca]